MLAGGIVMKRLLASVAFLLLGTISGFAQNTSIQYPLATPPMPGRQVPSAANTMAMPGMPNSGMTVSKHMFGKHKHSHRAITSEPVVTVEPTSEKNRAKNK